jgi:hypothetical protein
MKRPGQYRKRIAREGAKAAAVKFAASRDTIEKAMKAIEADLKKGGGKYLAGRRINTAEVLRRAGKSPSYLNKAKEQPALVQIKLDIEDFVKRVTTDAPDGIHAVHRAVVGQTRSAQEELDRVRQAYSESELELSDAQAELRTANATIDTLHAENVALLKKLSGRTVVELPTRRK